MNWPSLIWSAGLRTRLRKCEYMCVRWTQLLGDYCALLFQKITHLTSSVKNSAASTQSCTWDMSIYLFMQHNVLFSIGKPNHIHKCVAFTYLTHLKVYFLRKFLFAIYMKKNSGAFWDFLRKFFMYAGRHNSFNFMVKVFQTYY